MIVSIVNLSDIPYKFINSFTFVYMKENVLIEICADSIESALAAQHGGAHRVELCSALNVGGLTPSIGLIEQAISRLNIPVHVLIRPRSGDFVYSDAEFDVLKSDIHSAKMAGAAGIVTGILHADTTVDVLRMKELIDICGYLPITFHRAFDMTCNKQGALEQIINIGCKRILTSGGFKSSIEGRELIAEFVQQAGNRIIIMAGAGINKENFLELHAATKCREYHLSASHLRTSQMVYENLLLQDTLPTSYTETDSKRVQAVCNLASSLPV